MNWFYIQCLFVLFLSFSSQRANTAENFCRSSYITSSLDVSNLMLLKQEIIPDLNRSNKGDAGKVGIIGGSIEYTGAPYFSAITALKVGADLVYVITTDTAAPVIKSYSPDLIVYPFLRYSTENLSKIKALLPKMDVIVIGPGLGRENDTLQLVYNIIQYCREFRKPLVIDADGLYAVSKNISIIKEYPCPGLILTPNKREAEKLQESVKNSSVDNWYKYWGNCVSVLVKGASDQHYSNEPYYMWSNGDGGSERRAAGQGDILSGALGTYLNWALKSKLCDNIQLRHSVASFTASKFTRMCNSVAYQKYGRSMIASDMLNEIHKVLDLLFN